MAHAQRARVLAVTNALVVVGVVVWNYWTGVHGLAGNTIAGLSERYETLFTPAGYAFSIWGAIFLGLLVNAVYQLWLAFRRAPPPELAVDDALARHRATFFERLGPWLILTNLANALWIVLWLTEQTAASVVVLAIMFVLLGVSMARLDMEIWDAPLEVIALVWWPIVVYAGWVTVAVLANLGAFLTGRGWVPADSAAWAIAMIALATVYNIALVVRRNLREHAGVAIWALVAIAVKQWGEVASVQWTALACAGLLGVVAGAHAFANRRTLPIVRRWWGRDVA